MLILVLSDNINGGILMGKQRKRKSSVARKMSVILIILGLITTLMCFLNVMAYDVLAEYNASLEETVLKLQTASGKEAEDLVQETDYLMERIDIKIDGTYIFDIILLGVALVITVIAIVIALRMIAIPTKKVSSALEEIVLLLDIRHGSPP